MLEDLIKALNFESLSDENLNDIKECFISFYGEDRRVEVEEKLNKTLVFPYYSIEQWYRNINSIKSILKKEILKKIIKSSEIDYDEISDFFDFYDINENPVIKYYEFYNKVKETKDISLIPHDNVMEISDNITAKNILDDNYDEITLYLNEIKPIIEKIYKEYDYILSKLKEIDEINLKLNDARDKLQTKYILEFISLYKDFIKDDYNKIIEDYNKNGILFIYEYSHLSSIMNVNFNISYINAFSEESEKNINNPAYASSIKENRISYYKKLGINLGKDYEKYENDEECKKLKPDIEFIKKLKIDLMKISNKFKQQLYMYYPYYAKVVDALKKHNVVTELDLINIFETDINCCCFAIHANNNNQLESLPIVFIDLSNDNKKLDHIIIHELNHAFEENFVNITSENFTMTCGWETITYDNNISIEKKVEETKEYSNFPFRGNELFSEIINDLLAEMICKKLHNGGKSILTDKNNAVYDFAVYRQTTFLVQDFFKLFFNSIIASRNGNMQAIYDEVGKENFESLNNLFHRLINLFEDGFLFNKPDLNDNNDEYKEKMAGIIKAKDEIINKMLEYSKSIKKAI